MVDCWVSLSQLSNRHTSHICIKLKQIPLNVCLWIQLARSWSSSSKHSRLIFAEWTPVDDLTAFTNCHGLLWHATALSALQNLKHSTECWWVFSNVTAHHFCLHQMSVASVSDRGVSILQTSQHGHHAWADQDRGSFPPPEVTSLRGTRGLSHKMCEPCLMDIYTYP